MEQSYRIGPRIQIALTRLQQQEERVRAASRDLQQARTQLSLGQGQQSELADQVKQMESRQTQISDPAERKQLDSAVAETKARIERLTGMQQLYRTRESEFNSVLLTEQSKWDEANDALRSIERALAQPVQ